MWDDLIWLGVTVRPLAGEGPPVIGNPSNFSAPFRQTARLLTRELEMLGARQIVLQLDITEADLRLDGMPRANARLGSPAIVLSFESRFGPLRYATGEFATWQDNLRAVALSLEALRKVDRYGVSRRGEQYRGWRAIPMSTSAEDSIVTREQAEALLGRYGGLNEALKATHPDRGGDAAEFRKVVRARELLGV